MTKRAEKRWGDQQREIEKEAARVVFIFLRFYTGTFSFCFWVQIVLCDLYKTRADLQGDRLMEQKQLAFSQGPSKVRDNRRSISQQGDFFLWNLVWILAMKVSNRWEERDTRFDRIHNLKHLENFLFGAEYESLIIISVVSFFPIHFYSLLTWAFSHFRQRVLKQKLCVIN